MILNLSQVQECGFLIFFNKSDIFDEKVSDEHFRPDFRTFLKEFIKEDELKKYERGNCKPSKTVVFYQCNTASNFTTARKIFNL